MLSLSPFFIRRPRPTLERTTGFRLPLLLLCATAFAVAMLPATAAQAALLSTGACNEAPLSQPFAQWGDDSSYELVPQGNFESSLSQWTLTGGAARAPESEPYGVTGEVGHYSLALPAGATAQSPYTCVNASYPSFRFFARNKGLLSTVLVQVVYKTVLGPVALPLGAVALSGSWQPTLPMLTGSVVGGLLSGGTAQVALRFTALTGESRIDDIYIDPRMR
ncbi:MAG TPA: hypothetical protein VNV42_16450 [Solirubrobacteraceae bacterium]|nr:hypothetical protein [Solirubrobacteraceae bacterium]